MHAPGATAAGHAPCTKPEERPEDGPRRRPIDAWIERLARLFREHPAWREAARSIDLGSTSSVFFSHRPGEAWHLERRDDETLLLPGAAPDPDFVFRFAPGAIEKLEAVEGGAGAFAMELFERVLSDDPQTRVDLRVAAPYPRLMWRGYVRLLLAGGSELRAFGRRYGVVGLSGVRRLVSGLAGTGPRDWESGTTTPQRERPRAGS